MRILKAGVIYFALVFAVGFVHGTARTLSVVLRLGERTAELIEMPLMLVVTILAARWIVRRFDLPATFSTRIGVGLIALALLLVVDSAARGPRVNLIAKPQPAFV